MAKTLSDWEDVIRDEKPYVNKRPYSHNIIGVALGAIAKLAGDEEANKVIRELGLAKLGWKEVRR